MPEQMPFDNLVPFERFKKKKNERDLSAAHQRMLESEEAYQALDTEISELLEEIAIEQSKPVEAQNHEFMAELGERLAELFAQQDALLDEADTLDARVAGALDESEKNSSI